MPSDYLEVTTAWDIPIQSLDGSFWAYQVCPEGIQTHEQIEFDASLFYNEENV